VNDAAERLLKQAMDLSNQAVLMLERFREGAHLAMVADEISSASRAQIGEIYVAHLRCCWGDELDQVARSRNRELDAVTNQCPF